MNMIGSMHEKIFAKMVLHYTALCGYGRGLFSLNAEIIRYDIIIEFIQILVAGLV